MNYSKPDSSSSALRLHLNENTAGCSPKVLEAIRAVEAERIALYPDYEDATRECAEFLGVDRSCVVLTNGLDEGIWAAAAACIRAGDRDAEAIVPEPAFDMYAASVEAAGGREDAGDDVAECVAIVARLDVGLVQQLVRGNQISRARGMHAQHKQHRRRSRTIVRDVESSADLH